MILCLLLLCSSLGQALPIPKTLVCNYELPEIVQRYSDNTSKPLIGASEDTRKKRKVVLPVAGMKDIGSSQPSACAAVADAGAPSGVETSSNHDAGDSKKLSESYKEMVQRNLQMVERRKERRDMILAYKEGDSIDPFLPTAFATGKLSATDAATVKYFPQFIEMQRRQLLGEPSWWSFLKEGEDKYIAEGKLFLTQQLLHILHRCNRRQSVACTDCIFTTFSCLLTLMSPYLNGTYLCSFSP